MPTETVLPPHLKIIKDRIQPLLNVGSWMFVPSKGRTPVCAKCFEAWAMTELPEYGEDDETNLFFIDRCVPLDPDTPEHATMAKTICADCGQEVNLETPIV